MFSIQQLSLKRHLCGWEAGGSLHSLRFGERMTGINGTTCHVLPGLETNCGGLRKSATILWRRGTNGEQSLRLLQLRYHIFDILIKISDHDPENTFESCDQSYDVRFWLQMNFRLHLSVLWASFQKWQVAVTCIFWFHGYFQRSLFCGFPKHSDHRWMKPPCVSATSCRPEEMWLRWLDLIGPQTQVPHGSFPFLFDTRL